MPLLNEELSTLGNAAYLGVGGLVLGIVLTRSVHLGIILALIGGCVGWYQCRQRMRAKAHRLVLHLPKILCKLLQNKWKSNIKRYANALKRPDEVDEYLKERRGQPAYGVLFFHPASAMSL